MALEGGMAEYLPHDGVGRLVLSGQSRLPSTGFESVLPKPNFLTE